MESLKTAPIECVNTAIDIAISITPPKIPHTTKITSNILSLKFDISLISLCPPSSVSHVTSATTNSFQSNSPNNNANTDLNAVLNESKFTALPEETNTSDNTKPNIITPINILKFNASAITCSSILTNGPIESKTRNKFTARTKFNIIINDSSE